MKWHQRVFAMTAIGAAAIAAMPSTTAYAAGDGHNKLHVVSKVNGLQFTLLNDLPKGPYKATDGPDCNPHTAKPTSEAARFVAGHGWAVTGEANLGPYQVVSFAGEFEQGTSGTCATAQGNTGFFLGSKLVALIYAPHGSQETIGTIVPIEGSILRLFDGGILSMPVGDIQIAEDGSLQLGKLAPEEPLCHGKAFVPNIYNMPIDKARKLLIARGWHPIDGEIASRTVLTRSEKAGREITFVKRGIVEVESCAGTGLAYCSFKYGGPGGTLDVTTAGDGEDSGVLPSVVGYGVKCH